MKSSTDNKTKDMKAREVWTDHVTDTLDKTIEDNMEDETQAPKRDNKLDLDLNEEEMESLPDDIKGNTKILKCIHFALK